MNRRSSLFRRQPSVSGSVVNGNDTNETVSAQSKESHTSTSTAPRIFKDLRDQVKKGMHIADTSTVSAVVDAIRHPDAIDDRTLAVSTPLGKHDRD
ncbi:hypothetical protein C8R43DRAFT_1126080 [Mycena crocata]|nr:hypothetical protein C8R43DRAFT_1126080 [Mycena crocata]